MPPLLGLYLNPANSGGVEPAPNSTLLNDSLNPEFAITPGLTYRLRIISMSAMAANYIQIQDHEMTMIAVDGVEVQPVTADSVYISAAQRIDVLFTAKTQVSQNYFIVSTLDQTMYGGYFDISIPTTYGYLVYNPKAPLPATYLPNFNPVDDFTLVPYDREAILSPVSQTITINMIFENDQYNINRSVAASLERNNH